VPWTSMCLTCQTDSEAGQHSTGPLAGLGSQDPLTGDVSDEVR
jgi:hypothetical protein